MIVNADDFGHSSPVNHAVASAFEAKLISSTTIMANMPGFEEACQLAHERRLLAHVGVHLVLTEGEPLTEPIRSTPFCSTSGQFTDWRRQMRAVWLQAPDRDAVVRELQAQALRCRSSGLPITHFDSHQQVHNQPAICSLVVGLARALGVAGVRIARNRGPAMSKKHRALTSYVNARLRLAGLARTRYFGTVSDYVQAKSSSLSHAAIDSFEIMTHPGYDAGRSLVDRLAPEESLEELLSPVDTADAVSFSGARYG